MHFAKEGKHMNRRRLCATATLAMIFLAASVVLIAASNPRAVRIMDQCDSTTFNAAVGPGTCVGDGTITFAHFIAEVTAAQKAGAWHFDPADVNVDEGTVLTLENRGGETHTFTKVANFGGGFVAPLNALSGNPVPAPECATVTLGGLIPKPESPANIFVQAGTTAAGPTAGGSILPSGKTTRFQCCIHPWMRTEVTTR
jgi:plastocyanin